MVTAGTLHKEHVLTTPDRLEFAMGTLFDVTNKFGWELQAWAILSNHYHLVALSPEDATSLHQLIGEFHSRLSGELNRLDGAPGRQIWFNYWDTSLTYHRSYMARLHYVHENPVRHKVAKRAESYRWCSAAWFVRNAESAYRKTVYSFPIDRLNVRDDF
jgi:putative transposase